MRGSSGCLAAVTYCIAIVFVLVESLSLKSAYLTHGDTVVLVGVSYLCGGLTGVTLGIAKIVKVVGRDSVLAANVTVSITNALIGVLGLSVIAADVTDGIAGVLVGVVGVSGLFKALVTGVVTVIIVKVVNLSYRAAVVTNVVTRVFPLVTGVFSEKSALVTLSVASVFPNVRDLGEGVSGKSANVTVGIASVVVLVRRDSGSAADIALVVAGGLPVRSGSEESAALYVTAVVTVVIVNVLYNSGVVTSDNVTYGVTVVIVLVLGKSGVGTSDNVTFGIAIVIKLMLDLSLEAASVLTFGIACKELVIYVSLEFAIRIITNIVTDVVEVMLGGSFFAANVTVGVAVVGIAMLDLIRSLLLTYGAYRAAFGVVAMYYLIKSLVSALAAICIACVVVVVVNGSLYSANVTLGITFIVVGVAKSASLVEAVGIVTDGVAAAGVKMRGSSGDAAVVTVSVALV